MTRYEKNETVKRGYYLNPVTLALTLVERDGGRLPNEPGRWYAIPALAALALTPFLGALFLMFLPVIGFVLTGEAAARNVAALFTGTAGELAVAVAPGWVTGESHLTGKAERREAKEEIDPIDARLMELEREIERRRFAA